MLPSAPVYSLRCEHSELPRSPTVAAALVDLIRVGHTRRLRAGIGARAGQLIHLTDTFIQHELSQKLDWHHLSVAERRHYLDHISAPPPWYRAARARRNSKDVSRAAKLRQM